MVMIRSRVDNALHFFASLVLTDNNIILLNDKLLIVLYTLHLKKQHKNLEEALDKNNGAVQINTVYLPAKGVHYDYHYHGQS